MERIFIYIPTKVSFHLQMTAQNTLVKNQIIVLRVIQLEESKYLNILVLQNLLS